MTKHTNPKVYRSATKVNVGRGPEAGDHLFDGRLRVSIKAIGPDYVCMVHGHGMEGADDVGAIQTAR